MPLLISLTVFSMVAVRAQSPPASKRAPATIAGRVTLDGAGAPGAHVVLKPDVDDNNPIINFAVEQSPAPSAVTDAEGRYRLTDVAPGAYRATVFALAFVIKGEGLYTRPGKTVNVAEGDNVENVDFSLTRGAVITGKVTDDKDRPVIAAPVNAYLLNMYGAPRPLSTFESRHVRWETDDRGVYRIFGLEAGRYMVAAGFETGGGRRGGFRQTFHPDAVYDEQARVVEVSSGEEATKVDIKVAAPVKGYVVTGRAVDADSGEPVPGVTVNYRGAFDSGSGSAVANALGEFRLENLIPSNYRAQIINFNAQGQGAPTLGEEIKFEVIDSDVSGLELRTSRGATISGVVAIESSNDPSLRAKLAQVSLFVQSYGMRLTTGPGGNGTISPNGTFKLSNVQPGKNFIGIGFDPPKGFALLRVEHNGVEVKGINVNAGDRITGVRLVFAYGNGVIAGRVEVKGGSLPGGARMRVGCIREGMMLAMEMARFIEVDGRGQFLIEGLRQGTYKVNLWVIDAGDIKPPVIEQTITVSGEGRHEVTFIVDLASKERDK